MGEAYNLVVSICLNVLKGVKKKLYENVDAQKEPSRHLRAPVQGRCDGRQEGSLYAQASGIGERSQPPRHQSLPISQVQGNGHGTVRLETLLLVPDQRGYPVLARFPPPSPRDRAGNVETRHAPRAPPAGRRTVGDKTGDAGAGASQGFEFRGGFGRGKPAATE